MLDNWLKLTSPERRPYEDEAKESSKNLDIKLAPIKSELSLKDALPINEASSCSTSSQTQPKKSFQLQELLDDSTPEILEASVEQGVRLLDTLKQPLLDKTSANPDAAQWIQQIGTHSCHILFDIH